MGILDDLFDSLTPDQKRDLAKSAARSAVKRAGDAAYERVDEIREDLERAARERRQARDREAERERKAAEAQRAEREIDDELAALKRRLADQD